MSYKRDQYKCPIHLCNPLAKLIYYRRFSIIIFLSNLFDKYGRAICDIVIAEDDTNINQWLVEKGWAFPYFYNSMSESEIKVLKERGAQASNPPIEKAIQKN